MNIDEINKEIKSLEETEYTTYGNCYKLAMLYIVREHFPKKEKEVKKVNNNMDISQTALPPMK